MTPDTIARLTREYDHALRRAGLHAIDTDKNTCNYGLHTNDVFAHYVDPKPGYYRRCEEEIARRCARTVGFCSLDTWLAFAEYEAGPAQSELVA